jgi:hypothetical protein
MSLSHQVGVLETDPTCSTPDLSAVTSCCSSQLAALCSLRIADVCQFALIRAQKKLISKTVLCKMNRQSPGVAAVAAPLSVAAPRPALMTPLLSPTLSYHQLNRPCAAINQISLWPLALARSTLLPTFKVPNPAGFQRCMFCGGTAHVFRGCPQHNTPGASAVFYKNVFAHKPHLRKLAPRPKEMLPATPSLAGPPATQYFLCSSCSIFCPCSSCSCLSTRSTTCHPVHRQCLHVSVHFPSCAGCPIAPPTTQTFCPARHLTAPTALPLMPIAIDNNLPHITFDLGSSYTTQDPSLCSLMDCGTLNTRYLPLDLWLKSERPDFVAEFISFDDANITSELFRAFGTCTRGMY